LLSQEDKPQSQEKFHVRRGIHRSSVSQIIHKDLRLRCYKKRRAQQLTEVHSMHSLFSVCSLRDDNVITSKRTWKLKHANSILEPSEYFCQISSKSIYIISSYIVSKLGHFWDTVYIQIRCRWLRDHLQFRWFHIYPDYFQYFYEFLSTSTLPLRKKQLYLSLSLITFLFLYLQIRLQRSCVFELFFCSSPVSQFC